MRHDIMTVAAVATPTTTTLPTTRTAEDHDAARLVLHTVATNQKTDVALARDTVRLLHALVEIITATPNHVAEARHQHIPPIQEVEVMEAGIAVAEMILRLEMSKIVTVTVTGPREEHQLTTTTCLEAADAKLLVTTTEKPAALVAARLPAKPRQRRRQAGPRNGMSLQRKDNAALNREHAPTTAAAAAAAEETHQPEGASMLLL